MGIFDEVESNVRYYCRRWPTVFATASGATLVDEEGHRFVDFFSGAGALSYGHNHPMLVELAIEHLRCNRVVHSLDVHTPEKREFLESLRDCVLVPRNLDMKAQFVGPTGATAVEAALRLAAKITGRSAAVAYQGGYHGMTAGAASVSAALDHDPNVCANDAVNFLPYVARDCDMERSRLEAALQTSFNGQPPGALIIEATQGEGGARPFDPGYLGEVRNLCTRYGVVLIADEVQAGVGRTGPFFSFEGSALDPDIICLSKSLSGLGLPLAVNLVRREFDQWVPGEFSGTFRGSNLAFATASSVLQRYWSDQRLQDRTAIREQRVRASLMELSDDHSPIPFTVHGRGLLLGMEFGSAEIAAAVADAAFGVGLIIETCGPGQNTVKLLPSLLIEDGELTEGLDRLGEALRLAQHDLRLNQLVGGASR